MVRVPDFTFHRAARDPSSWHAVIPNANHFFENCVDNLIVEVSGYLDKRLGNPARTPIPARGDN